jgi:hypothetical protein
VIVDRQFPSDRHALIESIKRETVDSKVVAIHAGHFLLHYDEDEKRLVPGIASEKSSPRYDVIRKEFDQFPLLTWKLACRIMESLSNVSRHMLTIVNDWQYVPSGVNRESFYAAFANLPASYVDEARAVHSAGAKLLTPKGSAEFTQSHPYFSERALRNRYLRRIKRLIKQGALPEGARVDFSEDGAACSLLDVMGRKTEIYCSSKDADCSSEVAELIDEAFSLINCDTFINLYPAICKEYVESGSELPARLFGTGVSRTVLPSARRSTRSEAISGSACWAMSSESRRSLRSRMRR